MRMKIGNFIFRIDVSCCVWWKIGVPTDACYKRWHRLVPDPQLAIGSLAHCWITQVYCEISSRQGVVQFFLGNKSVDRDQIAHRQFADGPLEFARFFDLA